ncbi:hypothetical protein ATO2_14420 [Roseovarius sp. 22II1-1F6A]|nr:hypothetical protein ATO2_14420 [Roseovarius sp. 22II1-1F6A]
MFSAEQSGRGRSPTHGPEPDSQRIGGEVGAARRPEAEDTVLVGDDAPARRLSFDFPEQVCWADQIKENCQGGGERAHVRRSPVLTSETM